MRKWLLLFLLLAPALMAAQRQVFLETVGEEWCTYCRCAWHTFDEIQQDYPDGAVNTLVWSGDVDETSYYLRRKQYTVRATPASFVDGIISKEGAYGSGSTCAGDSDHCTYDYFMGNDNAACSLKNNEGVADRMPVAAPLSIAIASVYDAGARGGTLTVTVALDAPLVPPDGTVNLVTILLYEWHVGYANNSARYPRVARASLQTKQVTVTQPGETQTFSVNYLLDAAWNAEAMGAMAFVQNYKGGPSTSPDKLVPQVVHNSAFLGDIITPPEDRHPRPVSKP